MTETQFAEVEKLGAEMLKHKVAMATGDPAGELAQNCGYASPVAVLYWDHYTKKPMPALPGCMWMMEILLPIMTGYSRAAVFLRDAILIYTECTIRRKRTLIPKL